MINKCSRDSLSAPQNEHNGDEAIKPILDRKALVNYLLKILY